MEQERGQGFQTDDGAVYVMPIAEQECRGWIDFDLCLDLRPEEIFTIDIDK